MRIALAPVLSLMLMAGAANAEQCNIMIFFPFNSATIPAEYLPAIDKMNDALRSGKIEIFGHTDLVGSAAYNQALSERRALAVENRLLANGVPADNIVRVEGLGKSDPVVNTPGPNQENRRVIVQIDDCRSAVFAGTGLGTAEAVGLGVLAAAIILSLGDDDNGSNSTTTTTTSRSGGGGS